MARSAFAQCPGQQLKSGRSNLFQRLNAPWRVPTISVLPAPKKEFVIKSVGPDHFTVPIPAVSETPLMKQYYQLKQQHPGAVLLFRVGDFYETFGEDAVTAARILDITLTRRGAGTASETPLAGFPHHALDTYLDRKSVV